MTAKGTSRGAAFGGGSAGATEGLENVARVRDVQKCPGALFTQGGAQTNEAESGQQV